MLRPARAGHLEFALSAPKLPVAPGCVGLADHVAAHLGLDHLGGHLLRALLDTRFFGLPLPLGSMLGGYLPSVRLLDLLGALLLPLAAHLGLHALAPKLPDVYKGTLPRPRGRMRDEGGTMAGGRANGVLGAPGPKEQTWRRRRRGRICASRARSRPQYTVLQMGTAHLSLLTGSKAASGDSVRLARGAQPG